MTKPNFFSITIATKPSGTLDAKHSCVYVDPNDISHIGLVVGDRMGYVGGNTPNYTFSIYRTGELKPINLKFSRSDYVFPRESTYMQDCYYLKQAVESFRNRIARAFEEYETFNVEMDDEFYFFLDTSDVQKVKEQATKAEKAAAEKEAEARAERLKKYAAFVTISEAKAEPNEKMV